MTIKVGLDKAHTWHNQMTFLIAITLSLFLIAIYERYIEEMRLSITPFIALRYTAFTARGSPISIRAASTSTVPSLDATTVATPEVPIESVAEIRLKAIKLYKEVRSSPL
jgi:hypothetical protein